jgi:hypothetical protein
MLFQTLHMPGVYTHLAENEAASYNFRDIITILEHAVENCLLLDDEEGRISRSIGSAIGGWPDTERKKADELWSYLKSRRLVKIRACTANHCGCHVAGCSHAIERIGCPEVEMVLALDSCGECSAFRNSVLPSQYIYSPFATKRLANKAIELNNSEWGRVEFEQQVWQPLFQHARIVKIYDRYISRSVRFKSNGSCTLSDNFERGLDWLIDQYVKFGQSQNKQLEIYCGVMTNWSYDKVLATANLMKGWEQRHTQQKGIPITVKVIHERPDHQMNHVRVLITNQIAIKIERGFDLLGDDNRVRDVMLSHVLNPEKYERYIGQMLVVI